MKHLDLLMLLCFNAALEEYKVIYPNGNLITLQKMT